MNNKTLHAIGIWIFLLGLVLILLTTVTCESNLPFRVTIFLGLASAVMTGVGYILIALFREVEDKWKKR